MPRPLLVFGIHSNTKCRDATITLLQFEKWGERFRSMAIFEDVEQINRNVHARFMDIVENQYSSLATQDRIEKYLDEVLKES